jgi:DNA repair ATPase RecN
MQKFILLRFQGHPIIVKEITMFMVTERVDPEELAHLQTRLTMTKAAHTKTNAAMKKVEDNYNSLKRNLDNLIAEFKSIKS